MEKKKPVAVVSKEKMNIKAKRKKVVKHVDKVDIQKQLEKKKKKQAKSELAS